MKRLKSEKDFNEIVNEVLNSTTGCKGVLLIIFSENMKAPYFCKFHPLLRGIAPDLLRRAADRLEIHIQSGKILRSKA